MIKVLPRAKLPTVAHTADEGKKGWIVRDNDTDLDDNKLPRAKRGKAKPDLVLNPEKMTSENTPAEMCDWAEQFGSYFKTSNFHC